MIFRFSIRKLLAATAIISIVLFVLVNFFNLFNKPQDTVGRRINYNELTLTLGDMAEEVARGDDVWQPGVDFWGKTITKRWNGKIQSVSKHGDLTVLDRATGKVRNVRLDLSTLGTKVRSGYVAIELERRESEIRGSDAIVLETGTGYAFFGPPDAFVLMRFDNRWIFLNEL